MKADFIGKDGKRKSLIMGCYGIGVGRLIATVVEALNDSNGIIWPKNIAPYDAHLILINNKQDKNSKIKEKAEKIYQSLQEQKIEVLYDDRSISPGIKLKDADLIGIPYRIVISEKTGDKVELKMRSQKETVLLDIEEVIKRLNPKS